VGKLAAAFTSVASLEFGVTWASEAFTLATYSGST
jgi:hypothetical protein